MADPIRSEYAANVALQAPRGSQAWLKASTCRRPARRSLLGRLLARFTEVCHG